jgi:ABC-type transport system substrate-binding protein
MRSIRTRFDVLAMGAAGLSGGILATPLACRQELAAPLDSARSADAMPRYGGVLHLAHMGDVRNLDPAGPTDGVAQQAQHLLFSGLVDFDEQGRVVPDLAAHWDVEDDGRTYRFALRTGVRMHDEQELTADDIKRSVERALHPSTPNPSASAFENMDGYLPFAAGAADHLSGVVCEGRYVVSFHLREPDKTFLPLMGMLSLRPVCKSAGDRYVDTWAPCGAGPFKLPPGGWQRGTSLRLVRHPSYFREGLPYLDAVEWTFNVTVVAQRFRFEDGALDLLRDMTQADQTRFTSDPRWAPLGAAEADRSVLGESMNTRMAPFDNIEIRRAVAAAIDRAHYQAIKPANMTTITQLLPPGVPGYDPTFQGQHYDYAAALEHMRRAGYPYDPITGVGGWPETIAYPLYDHGILLYTAQVLQQDLAKIGLRIELKLVSYPAFLALQQRPGGAAMSQANWEMDYPDPSSFFDFFTTPAIALDSSYNTAFYSNRRFDEIVVRARRESAPERRRDLYREANQILCDEAPWAFAYAYHFFDVRQPYVRGFKPHSVWTLDVSRVWLDRPPGSSLPGVGGTGP